MKTGSQRRSSLPNDRICSMKWTTGQAVYDNPKIGKRDGRKIEESPLERERLEELICHRDDTPHS